MSDNSPEVRLAASKAILAVGDLVATVRFYRECLGFTDEWLWGEPPDFGGVQWGRVGVMFLLCPALASRIEGHQHAFDVEGVDQLYDQHRKNGAPILSPIGDQPWGMREYTVRDPNGYHLRFGEPITSRASGRPAKALPSSVTLVERLPTYAEYARLVGAVCWMTSTDPKPAETALRNSLYGVVATDGHDIVGMARVVGDDALAYYVQDVVVRPDYQRNGIGTALMNAVMNYFQRSTPPKSAIGLFTGRRLAGFYECHGFEGPDTSPYGMYLKKRD